MAHRQTDSYHKGLNSAFDTAIILLRIQNLYHYIGLNVFNCHPRRALCDRRQNLAVLLDVEDSGAVGTDVRARLCRGISISEGHRSEIAEWDKATTLLIVLHDPFCVLLAKCGGRRE